MPAGLLPCTPAARQNGRLVVALLEQLRVLSVALFREPVRRDEAQRRGVHAVAHPRGTGTVIEQVAEVGVTVLRPHLGARHEELAIGLRRDVLRLERPREAWPS